MSSNTSNSAATFQITTSGSNVILPKGDLYVDTNAWLDIALNRQGGQAKQQFLLNYISQPDVTPIILWSPHNEGELLNGIQTDEYIKEAKNRGMTFNRAWKQLENTISEADARKISNNTLARYEALIRPFQSSLYEISDYNVMPTAKQIMRNYGIPVMDSMHLGYMKHEEVNDILTEDKRFNVVPGLNIFSTGMTTNGTNPFPIQSFIPKITT